MILGGILWRSSGLSDAKLTLHKHLDGGSQRATLESGVLGFARNVCQVVPGRRLESQDGGDRCSFGETSFIVAVFPPAWRI